MLQNLSKILVVDNEEREIEKIAAALNELGIPAHYSLYSQADPPKSPFSGIRLAFFDIKLHDGNPIEKQTINSFVNALKQHIDINNGPFVLIFWTYNSDVIDNIKQYVDSREKGLVPTPILIDCIDKTIIGNSEDLIKSIRSILSKDILELLFDYESKVTQAAGKTLKTIFDVVSNGQDSWGESKEFEENFDLVFSNVACEALGFDNAKLNPISAIRDGLNPILINELGNIELSNKWKNNLQHLIGIKEKHQFAKITKEYVCQLNSIYHLNLNTSNVSKLHRGIVIEFNPTDELMISNFGLPIKQIKHTFLPFIKDIPKEQKIEIKEQSKFVLLEISAACDFAQNNHRSYTFILGLLIPAFDLKLLNRRSDSIISSPFFSYQSKDYFLFFNARYTLHSTSEGSEVLGDILFRLKNDLLNIITTQYSNYISRLGVIQF